MMASRLADPDAGSISVRQAQSDDLAQMAAIERDRHGATAWSATQLANELAVGPDLRWYAVGVAEAESQAVELREADSRESGSQVVGYVGIGLSPPDCDVQTVTVAKEWSGKGVGRLLLATAIDRAKGFGCRQIFLEVRADNVAALALYRSFGFVRLSVRRKYYSDGADALNMRLRLKSTALEDAVHG